MGSKHAFEYSLQDRRRVQEDKGCKPRSTIGLPGGGTAAFTRFRRIKSSDARSAGSEKETLRGTPDLEH